MSMTLVQVVVSGLYGFDRSIKVWTSDANVYYFIDWAFGAIGPIPSDPLWAWQQEDEFSDYFSEVDEIENPVTTE